MSMPSKKTWLAIVLVPPCLIALFVLGLFLYVNATARPLHPDAQKVPIVTLPSESRRWEGAIAQAREAVRAALIAQNLPGVSVAVGAAGEIAWAEGFGYADIEKKTSVTPQTQFRAAQASIPITAAAVGLLVEKNRLNLDSDVQTYVPEFPEKQWPVTLRQLMAHTAGVRGDAGDEESLQPRCQRVADALPRFANDKLRFEPGTRSSFSSYGWILVSAAIEAVANEPFFTFMRTQILDPLHMDRTRRDLWTEAVPDRATFYFPRFGGDPRYGPELAREGDYSCFAGAGGFLSTPVDMVRFGLAMIGGKLLQRSTVEMLLTPQPLTTGEQHPYALGWRIENAQLSGRPVKMAVQGTKADFLGGSTSFKIVPDLGLVVVVMSNTGFADTSSVADKVLEPFAQPQSAGRQ